MQEVHAHIEASGVSCKTAAGPEGLLLDLDALNEISTRPDAVQSGASLDGTDVHMLSQVKPQACGSKGTAAEGPPTDAPGLKVRG
jgi:hypothetical protein